MSLACTNVGARFIDAMTGPTAPWVGGYLWGVTGSGKTHQAIREAASVNAALVNVTRFLLEMRDMAIDDEDPRWFDVKRLRGRKYLVFDDLGAEKMSEFSAALLYEWVDGRWSEELPTLITGNLSPEDLTKSHGDRLVSRILGFGPVRHFMGRDRRVAL